MRIPVRKEIVVEEGGEADLPLMPPILSPIPQAPRIFFEQLTPEALPPVEAAQAHSRRLWPWLLGGAVGGVWIGSDRRTDPSVQVDTVPDVDPGVPITTTPEPSTWLLMSLGLVVVGIVSRLRRVGSAG